MGFSKKTMDTTILEKIGLTKGESKVYLSLLKTGISSIGHLVKESQVSRSKIYEIMERLIEKGLVSFVTENGVKKFKALDPRFIPDYLDKEKQIIEDKKKVLNQILPTLLSYSRSKESIQSVEVFEGWRGIRNLFFHIIKDAQKGDEWYAFGIPKAMSDERIKLFASWRRETDKVGIKQKLIANKEIENSPELAPKSKFSEIKYIREETPTSVDIFKGNVILGVWTEKPIVILLKGKEIADSFKVYFNNMWKTAQK